MIPAQLNAETRLKDLEEAYPWLVDEVAGMDPRLKVAKTPVGRMLIRKSTVADVSRLSGYPVDKVLEELRKILAKHGIEA